MLVMPLVVVVWWCGRGWVRGTAGGGLALPRRVGSGEGGCVTKGVCSALRPLCVRSVPCG